MGLQRHVVKEVLEYVERNLDKELDLERIARHVGYSKFHLNRMFADEMGCTIYRYLQARRLTDAARKLVETDLPISQIAYESGYSSQQAFSLAFKRAYAWPPKAYRDLGIFWPRQEKPTMGLRAGAVRNRAGGIGGMAA